MNLKVWIQAQNETLPKTSMKTWFSSMRLLFSVNLCRLDNKQLICQSNLCKTSIKTPISSTTHITTAWRFDSSSFMCLRCIHDYTSHYNRTITTPSGFRKPSLYLQHVSIWASHCWSWLSSCHWAWNVGLSTHVRTMVAGSGDFAFGALLNA